MQCVLGLDFGTISVRSLIVDCSAGAEISTHEYVYPRGVIGDAHDDLVARHDPRDYLDGLEHVVRGALAGAPGAVVVGIGIDATGSSPLPVDAYNVPLATHAQWRDNNAAMCWLWKDHSSHVQAARITEVAARHRPHFLAKCGGVYSSEWFWSKIWRCLEISPEVYSAAFTWVESCDYLPSVLAGVTDPREIRRGVCAAGHKAMYCDEWDGLPDAEFLALLDPRLAELRGRLATAPCIDARASAGTLSEAWAARLGLRPGIPIAVGKIDVHYGAIGCGIAPGVLVKAIGTSSCDCAVVEASDDITGICGMVRGSILPDLVAIEAGQAAVGDLFKWFVEEVCQGDDALHAALVGEVAHQRPGQSGLLALDWNNGNRSVLANPRLSGLLIGQTLHTTRAEIYRALLESVAFGSRLIIERLRESGVPVERVVCCGGIAEKNPLFMQILADVTGCRLEVSDSSQACALGAAIAASVLAGAWPSIAEAQAKMARVKARAYVPETDAYDPLYALYRQLHDAFGGVSGAIDLSGIMKQLLELKWQATIRQARPRGG